MSSAEEIFMRQMYADKAAAKYQREIRNSMADQYNSLTGAGLANALGAGYGAAGQQAASTTRQAYPLVEKLRMRLNLRMGEDFPFDHVNPVMNDKKGNVTLFMIINGTPMIFEDDAAVFPSDSLIAKLNIAR